MSKKILKYSYFFFGLLAGILVALGLYFIILTVNINLYEAYNPLSTNKLTKTKAEKDQNIDTNNKISKPNTANKSSYPKINKDIDTIIQDIQQQYDSMQSVSKSEQRKFNNIGNDNIEIAKDELIYKKEISLKNINCLSNDDSKLTSLLTDNVESKKTENTLLIEFWKSPVNYFGYKYVNKKLILFGIFDFDYIEFVCLENILYIKYQLKYYKLDETKDFVSLEKLLNQNIINQLNNLLKK